MGNVVLYIAASLDGYIATDDGGVGWLDRFNDSGDDYGYAAFEQSIGAVIMGGKTYRQVLGFGEWPYTVPAYIVTSQPLAAQPTHDVHKVDGDFAALVRTIKSETDRDIFFVGGAQLTKSFVEQDLIDAYRIFIMPVLLGGGIRLFLELDSVQDVTLTDTKAYPSGVVELRYAINH